MELQDHPGDNISVFQAAVIESRFEELEALKFVFRILTHLMILFQNPKNVAPCKEKIMKQNRKFFGINKHKESRHIIDLCVIDHI